MKKLISSILICIICFSLMVCPAFAENPALSSVIEWRGDYTDSQSPKLIVTVKSGVRYNQRVTATMYTADVSNPTFTDYRRIQETTVKGNEKAEIVIPIGNDLNYQDTSGRHYKLKLRGSGLNAANVNETLDVYVLTSNDILGDNGVLAQINRADSTDAAKTSLNGMFNAVKMDSATLTDSRLQYFLSIKNDDFEDSFDSIADVEKAWKISELIQYLQSSGTTADGLKVMAEQYSDAININTTDEDYIAYSNAIYENVSSVKGTYEYKNKTGIGSGKALKTAIEQYQALNAINALTKVNEKAKTTIFKYDDTLGITEEYQTKFSDMLTDNPGNADKVLRIICDTPFTQPKEIEKKFRESIDEILNPSGDSGNGGNSGNGGGSGGSGGSSYSDEPTYSIQGVQEVESQQKTAFKDCSTDFWAYSYISELKEKNIIGGYADGNFYPSNKVTREEFVKMIILSVGLYDSASECNFDDVSKDDWYYSYVASAVNSGIVNGLDAQSFGTGKYITRENMAVIAARILKRFNKTAISSVNEFTDEESISEYALDSINMLTGMQILSGFEDGSIRPKENLTRAEAAKIIYMVMKTV